MVMDSITSVDLLTLQETLGHLHKVINGLSFYLNTVSLTGGEICHCCESFWYGGQLGISCDPHDEIRRLHEVSSLARLMHSISTPLDSASMNQICERIRTLFAPNPMHRLESGSYFKTPWLDEKLFTSAVVNLLIRVCKGLAVTDRHRSSHLQKEIMSIINNRFVRPYSLLLWSCAKQELQT